MIDTHCHIHSKFFELDEERVIKDSIEAGVERFICIGVDGDDSKDALEFARLHKETIRASIGLHPHDAKKGDTELQKLAELASDPLVIAVGECGIDYYYGHSDSEAQEDALRFQIDLALKHDLALVFHVRGKDDDQMDAFSDFFRILDDYINGGETIRGVVHSFTARQEALDGVLSRSLLVGVNGIATFTKSAQQLDALKHLDASNLVLETDAPFLTPVPKRGNVNTPEYMGYTAKFLAKLRGETLEQIISSTTSNANALFGWKQ